MALNSPDGSSPTGSPVKQSSDFKDFPLDHEGQIQSGQRSPENRLTSDNFKIVRDNADPVRALVSSKEALQRFNDTNLRLYQQNVRPRWLGRPISPPILPGSASFPQDFHDDWNKITAKYEQKLRKKVVNIMPQLLDSLDTEISSKRDENLKTVRELLKHTSPSQARRGETIYIRLCSRTERVPVMGSRHFHRHKYSGAGKHSRSSHRSLRV